jgi:YesN/AraC family two-component response regulator
MGGSTKVLIADDRSRSRKGLRALLSTNAQVEVVGEAKNGKEAVELAGDLLPDVVLMDVRMPVMSGVDATRTIKDRWPEVRVVVLSMYRRHLDEAKDAGADFFLEKGCPTQELFEAILGG